MFKTPVFNQRPVLVDVGVVERSIAALTEAHRVWGKKPNPAEATVAAALVAHCWPYVTRLLEDNCLPGRELHPAVLPYFEAFTKLSDWVAPEDPTRHYAHWLIGDAGDVDDQTWQRYMQRWSESRRAQGRRGVDPAD